MIKTNGGFCKFVVLLFLIIYLLQYIAIVAFNTNIVTFSGVLDLSIAVFLSIWFLITYRKRNIFCFELMFIPIFILGMFYSEIVLSTMTFISDGVGGAFRNAIQDSSIVHKSRLVQMIALTSFLYGSIRGNVLKSYESDIWHMRNEYLSVNFSLIIKLITILLLFELVVNYLNGSFSTWFSYDKGLSDNERNQGLGRIDSLCLLATVVEFTRLAKLRISSFRQFVSNIDKLYLFEISVVSFLLLISGNRNEMLLIFLPAVVAYSIFILTIPRKYVLLGLFTGALYFAYSGLTRQGGGVSIFDLDLYSVTRDFSLVQINCDYLVSYTDNGYLHLFRSIPASLLGGIPFIGPLIFNSLGLDLSDQSTYITTAGLAAWQGTGLGTSLVGDLYYNAKLPFVIVFMCLFGYVMSRLYVRFTFEKRYDLLSVIVYLYMVSNAVYFVRQQWDFPIARIIYSYILLFVLYHFFNKKNDLKRCQ